MPSQIVMPGAVRASWFGFRVAEFCTEGKQSTGHFTFEITCNTVLVP